MVIQNPFDRKKEPFKFFGFDAALSGDDSARVIDPERRRDWSFGYNVGLLAIAKQADKALAATAQEERPSAQDVDNPLWGTW